MQITFTVNLYTKNTTVENAFGGLLISLNWAEHIISNKHNGPIPNESKY